MPIPAFIAALPIEQRAVADRLGRSLVAHTVNPETVVAAVEFVIATAGITAKIDAGQRWLILRDSRVELLTLADAKVIPSGDWMAMDLWPILDHVRRTAARAQQFVRN